jgi:uncharacterized protein (TIGR02996 family)
VEWPYLDLGAVTLVDTDDRGVLVEYKAGYGRPDVPQHLLRLVPTGDTFVAEETTKPRRSTHREETVPAPFERTSLGNKWRLAWPQGATSIGGYARLVGWDDRFALVLDDRAVIVIDAESDRVVRLMLPLDELRWASDPIAAFGHVWIGLSDGVLAIPTSALETLAAGTDDLTLVRHYPLRKPKKRLRCVFLWFLQSGKAMLEIGNGKGSYDEPKLTIDMPNLGLAKYAPVTLVDELRAGHYTSLDVPGHERISIWTDTPFEIGTVKITVTRAKDPTGVAKKPASSLPSRRASEGELERLVAAIVANPSDDAQRAVLADLLLELGDPSAEAIVKLRADGKLSPAKLKEALGPLGIYLTKVECVGGFPVEATITRNAPDADDHPAELAAACADFRLGLIHTLHTQPGRRASPVIYARMIGAPIATGLRRVDVSDEESIEALVNAERDHLEWLDHVDFANADSMAQLAKPLFDRVTTVHTVVGLAHLQPLVNRLVKDKSKFFKRAPRRLVLDETRDRHAELLHALRIAWPKLPITALTVGGVTIERDGSMTGDDAKLLAVALRMFG